MKLYDYLIPMACSVAINMLIFGLFFTHKEPIAGQRWMQPGNTTFDSFTEYRIVEVRYPWVKIENLKGERRVIHRDTIMHDWVQIEP